MSKIVYVVMREYIDVEPDEQGPFIDCIFTQIQEAQAYVDEANRTHLESMGAGPPNYQFWVYGMAVMLDPEPYEGETSWVRAVTTGAIESTSTTGTDT